MSVSTLTPVPGAHHAPGTGAGIEPHPARLLHPVTARDHIAVRAATDPNIEAWLRHVTPTGACTRPVRLTGRLLTIEAATGRLLREMDTASMPDGVIYKACGNRRAAVCPDCARVYQRDAYQLLRAGLAGGKGVPATVARHPAVFPTFTAPSFGPVHTRRITRHTCTDRRRCDCRPAPCHPRRDADPCRHGHPMACYARHEETDRLLGRPLCADCYDYPHQVVWNLYAGELWRRTKQAAERWLDQLAAARGLVPNLTADGRRLPRVRLSHGKAAEFQQRGAVHFHALVRLDGIDPTDPDAIVPPPAGFTTTDLQDAIEHAAGQVAVDTPSHPDRPEGWHIVWGEQLATKHITLTSADTLTDAIVAGYLAKYATKSTEATGHSSARLTAETIDIYADPDGDHTARLIDTCWHLGRPLGEPDNPYARLRRWAHMLGFGGHFLTKARRYSVTFAVLRAARVAFHRPETTDAGGGAVRAVDHLDETTLIVGSLTYAGSGWHNTGDAILAATSAAMARARRQAARDAL